MVIVNIKRGKTYTYSTDGNSEHKKAKGTEKGVIKRRLALENYIDCIFNDKIILKSQQRSKSDYIVCTEQINKTTLSSNNDKKIANI